MKYILAVHLIVCHPTRNILLHALRNTQLFTTHQTKSRCYDDPATAYAPVDEEYDFQRIVVILKCPIKHRLPESDERRDNKFVKRGLIRKATITRKFLLRSIRGLAHGERTILSKKYQNYWPVTV